VRRLATLMLAWALSPATTVLNAAFLGLVLFLAGADPHRPIFWLPVALFLAFSLPYDIAAFVTQRQKGLSSIAVADAVVERLWPSRTDEEQH
jgi:hypothetical protein